MMIGIDTTETGQGPMSRLSEMHWIAGAVLTACLAGLGIAYIFIPTDNGQISAPNLEKNQGKGSGRSDFVMGPGAMSNASVPQEARSVSANMFVVDRHGKLIVNDSTKSALDVLLAELPPNPSPADLQKLRTTLLEDLSPDVAEKIVTLMQSYLEYRKAESALAVEVQSEKTIDAKEAFTKTMALRRSFFDAETAQALFGVQEALALYDIEATRIQADAKLGADQKSRRIKALRESLPAEVAGTALAPDNSVQLQEQVAALRQRGATENDVLQLRQQTLGNEGAKAVSEMEVQKNEWERRYQAYLQQKNLILVSSINPAQKQQQIEVLLRQHYSEEEVPAVKAYGSQ